MLITQSCLTLCDPLDCSPLGSSLSMGFSRQEYWSRLTFPSPGDLPKTGIKPRSPALQVDSLLPEPPGKLRETDVSQFPILPSSVSEFISANGGKMVALALGITFSLSVSKGRKWSYSSHISPFYGFNIPFSSLGVEETTTPWIYCCPRPGQTSGRLLLAKIKGQWLEGSQPTVSSRYNLGSNKC